MQAAQAVTAVQVDLCMNHNVSTSGTAAVVDGCRVLLTPLQRALVPPPMSAVAADFHQPVQCIAFGNHQGNEVCFAAYYSSVLESLAAAQAHAWMGSPTSLRLTGQHDLSAAAVPAVLLLAAVPAVLLLCLLCCCWLLQNVECMESPGRQAVCQ